MLRSTDQHHAVQTWNPSWPHPYRPGWTKRTGRSSQKKKTSQKGSIPTAADSATNISKEVAEVSVQTESLDEEEDVTREQLIHQCEEVSTLLDLLSGLADEDDYDSTFESNTDF